MTKWLQIFLKNDILNTYREIFKGARDILRISYNLYSLEVAAIKS